MMEALERELLADPLLQDVRRATTSELRAVRALEGGDALRLELQLLDGTRVRVEVPRGGSVATLKRAAQRAMADAASSREGDRRRRLSWKKVWKDWCLEFQGELLTDGRAALKAVGIASDGARLALRSLRDARVLSARAKKQERERARAKAKTPGRRR